MKYQIDGMTRTVFYGHVEADSEAEAIEAAKEAMVLDNSSTVHVDCTEVDWVDVMAEDVE